mmetsp:Transcript_57665/g.158386  ORF Transcript_57665/g.158386 Transcript_57665/m.158386 type:complete len:209 (+) Transcript_57665:43-669(+)
MTHTACFVRVWERTLGQHSGHRTQGTRVHTMDIHLVHRSLVAHHAAWGGDGSRANAALQDAMRTHNRHAAVLPRKLCMCPAPLSCLGHLSAEPIPTGTRPLRARETRAITRATAAGTATPTEEAAHMWNLGPSLDNSPDVLPPSPKSDAHGARGRALLSASTRRRAACTRAARACTLAMSASHWERTACWPVTSRRARTRWIQRRSSS